MLRAKQNRATSLISVNNLGLVSPGLSSIYKYHTKDQKLDHRLKKKKQKFTLMFRSIFDFQYLPQNLLQKPYKSDFLKQKWLKCDYLL